MLFFFCIVPYRKFRSPDHHSSCRSSATHSYRCAQYCCVSRQWDGYQCLGFLTCAQMLTHMIAHGDGGGGDIVRESVLELDSGRKSPCRTTTGDSNPHHYCARLFRQTLYQLSYSNPLKTFHMLLFAGTDTLPEELSLPLIMILKALLAGSACRFAQPLGQPPSHESDGRDAIQGGGGSEQTAEAQPGVLCRCWSHEGTRLRAATGAQRNRPWCSIYQSVSRIPFCCVIATWYIACFTGHSACTWDKSALISL